MALFDLEEKIIYTSVELEYKSKEKCYVLTLKGKHGNWESSSQGIRIYEVCDHLVHMSTGGLKPVGVYDNVEHMLNFFEIVYKCKPVLISTNEKQKRKP
jgi:hypothetical protein